MSNPREESMTSTITPVPARREQETERQSVPVIRGSAGIGPETTRLSPG